MPVPEIVHQLVQRFKDQKEAYHSSPYNEAQLRQEFLDPFFEALGWDVANKKGYAVQYREVIHEDSIHIKGSPNAKAPDYAFRLGGKRIFFVEAKKPAEDIENTREFAYQLKVYAWNAQLPLSILTDFEEFAVYDCRSKPNQTDSPAAGRIMYIRYDEYTERWDEIAGIFSPDAIRKGAFDKYAEDNTAKKGTIKVDDAFLQEIENWRILLARNIALRNPQVANERQLNFAVQMTIDRIIFLRICEDRGIESLNQLYDLGQGKDIYSRLVALYQKADLKYNSGLFHFKAESDNKNHVDAFTPTLTIDDKVLKEIIKSLYYPCPYVFKEIPVEILGQVYEQFLGKVIRLTTGHRAKVEEKPEVRKAGGVYYTPRYIVDYIVENTVGELLKGKTPREAAKLKIVDPACGSGSFLLGAFQYLMDWHEKYYLEHDPEKWTKGKDPRIIQIADGDWQLTTAEKKRILVNNLHGVDIDSQAVEVTKLSLLLKVLEEETGQLSLGFERVLPDLNNNIKCGNSLIGWDYFEGQLIPDESEVARVNPFDWEKAFPEVFASEANGGFNAVIGNPPYRKERDSKELLVDIKKSRYGELYYQGKMDFWYFFLHRAIDIVKASGFIAFIVPAYWLSSTGASKLIERVENCCSFINVVNFSKNKIFKDVSGRHMTFALAKKPKNIPLEYQKFINDDLNSREIESELKSNDKNSERFSIPNNKNVFTIDHKVNLESLKFSDLLSKINNNSFLLEGKEKAFEVSQGIIEAPDCVSNSICKRVKDFSRLGEGVFVISESKFKQLSFNPREMNYIKKYLAGEDVERYSFDYSGNYVFYISSSDNKFICSHKKDFPNIIRHLDNYKKYITSSSKPYGIHRTRDPKFFTQPKIIGNNMFDKPKFSYCDDEFYVNFSFNVVITNNENYSLKFVLGLFNSTLGAFWFDIFGKKRGVNVDIGVGVLRKFPVVKIDFNDINQSKYHERLIDLVNHMLELNKRTPQTPLELEQLEREIAATDAQIDLLVYDLYVLTEDEIKIVEGS